jgi:pimeloyl-ACP methyl ester carboxylesterase
MTDPIERQLQGDAGVLAVRDWGGTGPPLVLVHGIFGTVDYFNGLAPGLTKQYRVVGYDLRGHGQSQRGDPSLDAHVDDLIRSSIPSSCTP